MGLCGAGGGCTGDWSGLRNWGEGSGASTEWGLEVGWLGRGYLGTREGAKAGEW